MLKEDSYLPLVFELIDRGITADKIDVAMIKIVGKDWRELGVPIWLKRLKARGYLAHTTAELRADHLEVLLKTCMSMNDND